MKNFVQGEATYHLVHETDYSMEEFLMKFQKENIIEMKLLTTLSDGSVHTFTVCELLKAVVTSFEVDGEEIMEDSIEKKKITKLNLTNSVIKLAI